MKDTITPEEDFEGRKHVALFKPYQPALVAEFSAEGFSYKTYRIPPFDVVHMNPELDFEMPEHFMVMIWQSDKFAAGYGHVVSLRCPDLEFAKKEILDRVTGMLDMSITLAYGKLDHDL